MRSSGNNHNMAAHCGHVRQQGQLHDVALFLLGAPGLEQDEVPLSLGRRKPMALLSYLAVTRSHYRRGTVPTLRRLEYQERTPRTRHCAARSGSRGRQRCRECSRSPIAIEERATAGATGLHLCEPDTWQRDRGVLAGVFAGLLRQERVRSVGFEDVRELVKGLCDIRRANAEAGDVGASGRAG